MRSYLIIDDEPIAHRIIEGYCKDIPHLEKKGNCYNALEAIELLNKHSIDLIFLDLNMPKLSGFEFLKSLKLRPKVIVTTAYKEFALEGYELDIVDYLLKPFSFLRFLKAVNKAFANEDQNIIKSIDDGNLINTKDSIFLKEDKKIHQIKLDDLLFIQAYGNYSKVYHSKGKIITHATLSSFEQRLNPKNFIRSHKSYIVSKQKIESIEGNRIHISGHEIPIGQSYKLALQKIIVR